MIAQWSALAFSVVLTSVFAWDSHRVRRLQAYKQMSEEELLHPYLQQQNLRYELNHNDAAYLEDKVIAVFGAAGTIGAELVREVCKSRFAKLVLFDINENAIYDLRRELQEHYALTSPKVEFHLLDIRDQLKVNRVFEKYSPQVVFHYANYKSLALGNCSPEEFVSVNVGGTRNLLAASAQTVSLETFVYISSDKAETPSQTYGRTKRVCELLVRAFAANQTDKRYSSLRYCNILDAAGSFAIPTFRDQIVSKKKITVRRLPNQQIPDRYFIPKRMAAQIAIKSGTEARQGNIFSLNANVFKPLAIDQLVFILAKKFGVRNPLKWMKKHVQFVAAEKGEKNSESLGYGLALQGTPLVEIEQQLDFDVETFLQQIEQLLHRSKELCVHDHEKIEEYLKDLLLCVDFTHNLSTSDAMEGSSSTSRPASTTSMVNS